MKRVILSLFALMIAAPASASGQQSTNPVAGESDRSTTDTSESRTDRVVCRRLDATGSRVNASRRRVCMTEREWKDLERQ